MKLPKLHIRDLFWLVFVAALMCAWLVDRTRLRNDFEAERLKWSSSNGLIAGNQPSPAPIAKPEDDGWFWWWK